METEWRAPSLPLSDKDLAMWESAEEQIDANRCGGLVVRVVDVHGRPLRGVPVRYEQKRHAFRFGVHYPYDPVAYDLFQQAGINAATLWLGWEHVEPERGLFNWGYLERVWRPDELHRRGLEITAHALHWYKPRWRVLPAYLYEVPATRLPLLVYEHIGEIARHWGDKIDLYELVNEPFWVDAAAIPMALGDMIRVCQAAALAVRDAVADARLMVNFAEVSRTGTYGVRPCDFLEALDDAGVPYDLIGLQALENAYTVEDPPTFFRAKTLSGMILSLRQYASLGKPLDVSALAVPSLPPSRRPPAHFKLRYGVWDQALQAAYLDVAYTLFFAQPEVEGITWWCPVDGRLALVPGGGLLNEDLAPKPAYYALRQWILRHTTQGQAYTDDEGRAVIRGYSGEYELQVGAGPEGRRTVERIEPRLVADATVVLSGST
ncbi:MAG: endo-1,4-beta-xylanase [Chloroflexi bacterium]|nr:endo-1,4-beta-xylanase [Chloroflexota bacterium]